MTNNVFYPFLNRNYPVIEKAEGIYLYDTDGKQYIDACCGALVSNLGHNVEEIKHEISQQLEKVTFSHRFKFSNNHILTLADKIAGFTPGDVDKVTFVSSGSEATETTIKMARAYYVEKGQPSKYKIVSRWNSYHGNTLGALSISGSVGKRKPYVPMLINFPHAAPAFCYRCSFDKDENTCDLNCVQDIEQTILNEGPENIAGVIVEPVVGSSLCVSVPKAGYLERLREVCDKYDVLMIADEVMTGVGRTGEFFAVNHWNVVPDMIAMAKGLGGGFMPLGAVAVKNHIFETFKEGSGKFGHGFTYGSNPVSAAAGVAIIDYIQNNELLRNSTEQGAYLEKKLLELKNKYPFVGRVSGIGLMIGVEFVRDRTTKETFDENITNQIVETALDKGLVLYASAGFLDGARGDGVMIAPPLTVTKEEVDMIISKFEQVISKVFYDRE